MVASIGTVRNTDINEIMKGKWIRKKDGILMLDRKSIL